jgi:hypothetical protein
MNLTLHINLFFTCFQSALVPTVKMLLRKGKVPLIHLTSLLACMTGVLSDNPLVGVYDNAAVAIDGEPCATIGKDILLDGGTAVDATVGAMFCNGVYSCHSMGIGGGFLMTIYNRSSQTAEVLNARETATGLTTQDMFHGKFPKWDSFY